MMGFVAYRTYGYKKVGKRHFFSAENWDQARAKAEKACRWKGTNEKNWFNGLHLYAAEDKRILFGIIGDHKVAVRDNWFSETEGYKTGTKIY